MDRLNRRCLLGTSARSALAGLLGGAAAVALREDGSAGVPAAALPPGIMAQVEAAAAVDGISLAGITAGTYCTTTRVGCRCRYGYYSECSYCECCNNGTCTGCRWRSAPGYC
jgi:hypothetical protein